LPQRRGLPPGQPAAGALVRRKLAARRLGARNLCYRIERIEPRRRRARGHRAQPLPAAAGRTAHGVGTMAAGAAAGRWIVTSGAGSADGGLTKAWAGARARLKQGRPGICLAVRSGAAAGRKRCFERAIGK